MPAGSDRRLGSYQLLAPLATGGMAEIYVAKTLGVSGFEKRLALKVIHPNYSSDPEFVQMLVDEAKLAVQLSHANIVQTFDLGQVDEQYYIAMELIDGADLYKILRRSAEKNLDFPFDVAAFVAQEVCAGLDYAHRKCDPQGRPLEIVHRDVSPQNVLVSYEGEVKIVDFGIAKAAMRSQKTAAGVIKGKYFYMSPEQAWGDAIDSRSDVFSAGILLHEMIVGEMLYLEEDFEKLLQLVRKAEIQAPSTKRPGVPSELEEIVMRALCRRKEDRYQSAAELGHALQRFIRRSAPDFSRNRVAAFVHRVVGEDSAGRIEPAPASITAPSDLRDENSLLFRLADHAPLPSTPRGRDSRTRDIRVPDEAGDFGEAEATVVDTGQFSGTASGNGQHLPSGSELVPTGEHAASKRLDEFGDRDAAHAYEAPRGPRAQNAPPTGAAGASAADDEDTRQRFRPTVQLRGAGATPDGLQDAPSPLELAHTLAVSADQMFGKKGFNEATLVPPLPGPQAAPTMKFVDLTPEPTPTPAPVPYPSPIAPEQTEIPNPVARLAQGAGRRWGLLLFIGAVTAVTGVVALVMWPESVGKVKLAITSLPSGATVRVDGTVLPKTTPLEIHDIDPRMTLHIAVSLRGYEVWEKDARFEPGEHEVQLPAILTPTVGTLDIDSTPHGAEVIVNNRISGVTPTTVGDLPPNEDVHVELRLRGYKVASRFFSWGDKRRLTETIALEKAH
jgi:serine/threonine-protein kinase